MNIRSKVERDGVIIGGFALLVLIALVGVVAPDSLPVIGDVLIDISDQFPVIFIGVIMALILVGIAVKRSLTSKHSVDRTTFVDEEPESPVPQRSERNGVDVGMGIATVYESLESPPKYSRLEVMYGYSGLSLHGWEGGEYGEVMETLREIAIRVVAESRGCEYGQAKQLIDMGEWVDDQEVGAFLSTDAANAPSFTIRQRFEAFIWPQRTFERRLQKTISELERECTAFLSHEPMGEQPVVPGH